MMAKMLKATLVAPERIELGEAEIPTPGKDEVLIRVLRVGVCGSDPTIYFGRHPYVTYPVVMGHEFSGTVEALGEGAEGPAVGTRVAVIPHLVCGNAICAKRKFTISANPCGAQARRPTALTVNSSPCRSKW